MIISDLSQATASIGNADINNLYVSSSTVLSGSLSIPASTKFGDSLDDTHQFTGSILATGSNTFIGNQTVTGSLRTSGSNTLIGNTQLTGSFDITGSQTTVGYIGFLPVAGLPIPTNQTASYIYTSGSTNDLYFTQYSGQYTNTIRLRWLEGNIYTGILYGGIVSGSVSGTTFNVSSGSGIIVSINATQNEEPYPTVAYVNWDNFTNVTPTLLSTYDTTWLTINSAGGLEQSPTPPTNGDFDTKIQIGSLVHPNRTNISFYRTFTVPSYAVAQQTYEFIRSFGPIKVSGHTLSASGSSLSVNRSSGVAFALGRNYVNDPNKPSLVSDGAYNAPTLLRYYKSGSVFVTATGTNTLDVGNYNTPNTSTGLSSVPGGSYTVQRAFYFPNSPAQLGVYYGRDLYNSIASALQNYAFEEFEELENTLTQAIFAGYIIVKGNTTDLSNTADAKFLQAGSFRNTTSAGGGGAALQNIDDLADVVITTPAIGDLFYYNGSHWVNTKQMSGSYGFSGSINLSGSLSINGTTYTAATSGTAGTAGTTGTSGTTGTAGTAGSAGTSGVAGQAGTSGTTGTAGSAGTSGAKGIDGTSGTAGIAGSSGTSGATGAAGTSGTSGARGTSGTTGTAGTAGSAGTSGVAGAPGTSGTAGISGTTGTSGTSGISGQAGGVRYNFSTSTADADPGSGLVAYNNGAIGSVNVIYIDNVDQLGNTQTAWYDTWDDSTNTAARGTLTIYSRDTGTIVNTFTVTGAITVAAGYYKIPVSYVNGTLPSNGAQLAIMFSRTGNTGTSGTTGTAGTAGTTGTAGTAGSAGTSGIAGAPGTSGTTGTAGTAGSAGTSGVAGQAGTAGTSGASGVAGQAGTAGTSGTSGIRGTSGTSGAAGTSGTGFSTINNAGANRLLVSNGTANAATASSNITFDGTTFVVSPSGQTELQVTSTGVNIGNLSTDNHSVTGSLRGVNVLNFRTLGETYFSSSIAASTLILNITSGSVFSIRVNANIFTFTITGSNPGTTGVTLATVGDGTARTFSWGSIKWPSGTAPTYTSTNNKVDFYSFVTYDSGSNWYGFVGGQNF